MIRLSDLSFSYGESDFALRVPHLGVERGEAIAIVGPSGSGKTTLLRLIAPVERATNGQVVVGGQNLNRLKRRQIPYYRRHIGVVFQSPELSFDRTVFANIALSGGEQQRVRVARAVVNRPSILMT